MIAVRLAVLVLVAMSLWACRDTLPSATPNAPLDPSRLKDDVDPTGEVLQPGATVKSVSGEWLLLAYQKDEQPHQVVDYIIFRAQDPKPALHVECTKPEHGFPVFLRRDALDPGHYTLKVYMDKQQTPFATTSVQVP